MPASPESNTTWPSPFFAFDQRRSNNSSSSSRPTSLVRPPACRASNRLSTKLGRNAAEVPRPKVLKLEEGAEKSSRAVGDDDRIRLSDPLQSCREVRGLADNG